MDNLTSIEAMQIDAAVASVKQAMARICDRQQSSALSPLPLNIYAMFGLGDGACAGERKHDRSKRLQALHLCLTSSVQLLTVGHALLQEREANCPVTLIMDAKNAGRAAMRAALVLADDLDES